MTLPQIKTYYDASEHSEDLKLAVDLVKSRGVAIDCGCGAGSDTDFLLQKGFKVQAFDIEEDAAARCQKRFKGHDGLILYRDSFESFEYSKASLVLADASLFFFRSDKFNAVWDNIYQCLESNGIFCGSFLDDSMAQ